MDGLEAATNSPLTTFSSVYSQLLGWLTALTVVLQLYVVYLIQRASPKSMRDYRFFLLNFTVISCLLLL